LGVASSDKPECNDIGVQGKELQDLPCSVDDEPGTAVSNGALVDGGLLPKDALDSDALGIVAVQGFLVNNGSGVRLCELLAESLPPQCAGSSILVSGDDEVIAVPLENARGVTWTGQPVTLFGNVIDGTLIVDATVSG
jgi:hypothetical protein